MPAPGRTCTRFAVVVVAALGGMLAPAAAHAGTVSIDGGTVVFSDPDGAANRVDVTAGDTLDCPATAAWCVAVEDDVGAPASSDPRCVPDGIYTTTCGLPAKGAVIVDLGVGNDFLASLVGAGEVVTARGGPGNDELYGRTGQETLEGGDGDDALYPDDNPYSISDVPPGPDTIVGGSGTDTVWYIGHASGVRVALDGAANDGGSDPADIDNVLADVEGIVGSRSADVLAGGDAANAIDGRDGDDRIAGGGGDDALTGNSENDALDGGAGNDRLTGSSGDDSLLGGPGVDSFNGDSPDLLYAGNDTIDAVDGVGEPVSCGPGADLARVDASDQVANEAQNACETVQRSGAPGPEPGPGKPAFATIGNPSLKRGVVRVRITCTVTDPVGCNGKLALKTARKVRVGGRKRILALGGASFSLDPGQRRTLRVKLSRSARALFRRTRRVRTKLVATSTRPKGLQSARTVTLRRR